jgi:hypothetical protein
MAVVGGWRPFDTGTCGEALCSYDMPLYYFDFADRVDTDRDDVGTEFRDLKAARRGALQALGEIARDKLPDGDERVFKVSIRDEHGDTLFVATLALRIEPPE